MAKSFVNWKILSKDQTNQKKKKKQGEISKDMYYFFW